MAKPPEPVRSRPFVAVDPAALARARELYERGNTRVSEIAVLLGMSETTFYQRVRVWGWARRRRRRVGKNRPAGAGRGPVENWSPEADPALWLGSNWAPDGKVSERERRFVESPAANAEAALRRRDRETERWAAGMASLAKSLRELAEYDREQAERARKSGRDVGEAAGAADVEALQRVISEQLRRRFGAEAEAEPSRG
ncbi:hypothetical protein [Methylopila sp. M107]|uniref:hypothetical protein n=1 Tax=Methylopila sp. M107 TaxID=1101190 RepID=UPI00038124FB|nr:hypothetical protein [Methylopila sp. M107]